MFCRKCGKEIENNAKFCPHCGEVTAAGGANPAPESAAPSAFGPAENAAPGAGGARQWAEPDTGDGAVQWSDPGQGGKKRRGIGLIVGGAAAAVLVVVLIIVAAINLFSSPKGQVEKALGKTLDAYADVKDTVGVPDLAALLQGRAYSQGFSMTLNSVNQEFMDGDDLAALKGLGVRVDMDYDQKNQKMDFDMAAFWDDGDLMSIQMLVDGGKMIFASPEFTLGDAYGIDTETIGADLVRLGAWDENVDIEKIGFNLFDLLEQAVPSQEQTGETQSKASRQLLDAIEVEQVGKENIQVNGKSVDATHYHVVVPEDAMKDYIDVLEDAMKAVDYEDIMKNMLLAMGLDKSTVNQAMSEMGGYGYDYYGELADVMKQAVRAIGDVELEVYLSGGYVSAVEYSDRIEGSKVEIGLYLGGGSNYVDDLSLEISVDGETLTIESSGDHAAKSGVFTDETTIQGGGDRLTSVLRYAPKADKDNFDWEIKANGAASVAMEGQLTTTKDSIDLQVDDFSVKMAGVKLLSMEFAYYLGPCKGMQVSMPAPKMLADMDEQDLMELYYEIEDNVETWSDGLFGAMQPGQAGYDQPPAMGGNHVVNYRVDVPSGFESMEVEGTEEYWYNPADSSNINVVITEQDADDQSVDAVTADLLHTMLEETFKLTFGGEPKVTDRFFTKDNVCGLPSYQYCYDVDLDGITMTQLIVCVSADQIYTFTYTDTTGDWLTTFQASARNIQLIVE